MSPSLPNMDWRLPGGLPSGLVIALGVLLGGCALGMSGREAPRLQQDAAAAGASDSLAAGAAFTVGTFNIRLDTASDGDNAWPRRAAMVRDVLEGAEIWGLQEALPGQARAIAAAMPGLRMLVRSRDEDPGRDEACPIVWRGSLWDLDPREHGTFWLSEEPERPGSRSWDSSLPRICTFARLLPAAGAPKGRAPIYVFNVHFDHRGAQARAKSAELLQQRIACRAHPDPVILLGDFNAGPDSVPVRKLLAGAKDLPSRCPHDPSLRDAWREANQDAAERGTYTGWADSPEGPRIDFILVSPSLAVTCAAIDERRPGNRWPSDHMPVTATLLASPGQRR